MKTRKSFLLRIDPRLFQELEAWAAAEFRSVNAQVEFLLRECVSRRRKALPSGEMPGGPEAPDIPEGPHDSN
ncbi:hypothetical protein GC170_02220 [bacterium]|nr:hypothetical protein [bacterium]